MSVITLTGPTCSGKSSIERELQALGLGRAISHTTRRPRAGETQGVDYHFVSIADFDAMKAAGEFVETIELGMHRYAMSAQALHAAHAGHRNVVIVAEPNGTAQIRDWCLKNAVPCFSVWTDCSPEEQARRWVSRFAADMLIGKEAVGPYAERLGLMLTEEVKWREAAQTARLSGSHLAYHIIISDTAKATPRQHAKAIFDLHTPGSDPLVTSPF